MNTGFEDELKNWGLDLSPLNGMIGECSVAWRGGAQLWYSSKSEDSGFLRVGSHCCTSHQYFGRPGVVEVPSWSVD
jgi:hypothetical protein